MNSTSSQTLEEGIVRVHGFNKDNARELQQLVFLFQHYFPFASVSLAGTLALSTFLKSVTADPNGILLFDSKQTGIAVGSTHLQSTLYSQFKSTSLRALLAATFNLAKNPGLFILRGIWLIRLPKFQCGYIRFLQVKEQPVGVNSNRHDILRKCALIGSIEREFKLADCQQVWVELSKQQEEDLEAYLLRGFSLVDRGFNSYLLRKIFYS